MSLLVLPVQLGGTWVALDPTHVQEVLGPRRWVALPDAPAHVPGVIPWRGRAIALLDLAALLGMAAPLKPGTLPARTLVATIEDTTFGIPAERAREVTAVAGLEEAHATQARMAHSQVTVAGLVMPMVSLPLAFAAVARPEVTQA